jgi:hypothetical protein
MSHPATRPTISKPLQKVIDSLPHVEKNGLKIIESFGVFIDTHRDQPHIGTFTDDIHRGACRPMTVDYILGDDLLRDPETGRLIERHEKHLFITPEAWGSFMLNALATTGVDPRGGDGTLPTSHFRDARKGIYMLQSFRQMVAYNQRKK